MSLFDRVPLHDLADRGLRLLLEHPGNLHDLLSLVLPDLAAGLDFQRTQVIHPGFLLDAWRGRESDLLVEVPLRETPDPVVVCLMVEHQS